MSTRRKGIIHIGFGVILLILVVTYVILYFIAPSVAAGIRDAISGLVTSIAH